MNKGEKALGGGEPQLFKKHINESKYLHKKLSDKYNKLPEKENRKLANHPQVKERVNYIKNLDKKKNISDFDNQIDYSKTYNDSMKHLNKMLSDQVIQPKDADVVKGVVVIERDQTIQTVFHKKIRMRNR